MPIQTPEERAASRAEARRRARLAARGELPVEEETRMDPEPAPRRGGWFSAVFPSAPPLPGRPDPLAKFDRSGPLRPVRERLFLLRRNPHAWMLPSLASFVGYFAAQLWRGSTLGLLGTFLSFGALIAAGWIGWQRPALYGTVTAVIAFVLAFSVVLATFAQQGGGPLFAGLDDFSGLLVQGATQAVLGFVGGWYGGYLRRRQAQVSANVRSESGRRGR